MVAEVLEMAKTDLWQKLWEQYICLELLHRQMLVVAMEEQVPWERMERIIMNLGKIQPMEHKKFVRVAAVVVAAAVQDQHRRMPSEVEDHPVAVVAQAGQAQIMRRQQVLMVAVENQCRRTAEAVVMGTPAVHLVPRGALEHSMSRRRRQSMSKGQNYPLLLILQRNTQSLSILMEAHCLLRSTR